MIAPPNHTLGATYAARTRVVIADGQRVCRERLRRVLGAEPEMEVLAEAADAETAVRLTQALAPDVLLLDVLMPGKNGVETVRRVTQVAPQTRVLLVSADVTDSDLRDALRFGARGLVLKSSANALILKAIRSVTAGEYWISRDVVGKLARAFADSRPITLPASGDSEPLTARERQVARLLADGMSNREIANTLSISEDTVKHHLTHAFNKTGVSSRVELALRVINGSLDVQPSKRQIRHSGRF